MLKDIFEAETNKKERENKKLLGHFFSKSMIEDRVDFVAFLADKIDLKTYLTKVNQTKIYSSRFLIITYLHSMYEQLIASNLNGVVKRMR